MHNNINTNKKIPILILGSTGMLGSMILKVLQKNKLFSITSTARTKKQLTRLKKEYPDVAFSLLDASVISDKELNNLFKNKSWIINAIGIIKPFIHDTDGTEILQAIKINAFFPYRIANIAQKNSGRILQIATDCVYSGKKSNYKETEPQDPLDVYGKSKSLGEVFSPSVFNLRCSIIGPEQEEPKSLLSWLVNQDKTASVSGFSNHLWNGVTTYHFAKICEGIILHPQTLPHLQHIVPGDKVSKDTLLRLLAKYFNRNDIKIKKIKAKENINRTLSTINPHLNKKIWKIAGYTKPPTISEMIKELAAL